MAIELSRTAGATSTRLGRSWSVWLAVWRSAVGRLRRERSGFYSHEEARRYARQVEAWRNDSLRGGLW
jgi:hypothetical protein